MKIIDATKDILTSYENGQFNIEKWKAYIGSMLPDVKDICLRDMAESISAGLSWEDGYLPVLNSVFDNTEKISKIIKSFSKVTENLNERVYEKFGKSLDADIILYLGLCNGAGWVTKVSGKTTVLLGIEKIIELDWCDIDDMNGLILHELGHVYQAQYGVLNRQLASSRDQFLWQLFTEGIAMVFEQGNCRRSRLLPPGQSGMEKLVLPKFSAYSAILYQRSRYHDKRRSTLFRRLGQL